MLLLCFSLSVAVPNGFGTSPLTPSARISALNIVGDLLRKVGVSIQLFITRCFYCRGSIELSLSCGENHMKLSSTSCTDEQGLDLKKPQPWASGISGRAWALSLSM